MNRDPFLKQLRTSVISCEGTAEGTYAVILDDTIFHAESGGQPSDRGTIDGIDLLSLALDEKGNVIHVLPAPVSGEVFLVLDWQRRFDLMQQHTAQHILSALALDRYGFRTTAFHLGAVRSDIELDAPNLPFDDIHPLEELVNEALRENRAVECSTVLRDGADLAGIRARGLPENITDDLRIVEIAGLDRSTCCGTHVSSTGQVQLLKILGTEKARGGTRVFFLAGGRALRWTDDALARERLLSRMLTCAPGEHADAVRRLADGARAADKRIKALTLELASLLGHRIARDDGVAALHRDDADAEFLGTVAAEARKTSSSCRALLTGGERAGVFLLLGPPSWVIQAAPQVIRILEGRGGGSNGLFQGKASRLDRRSEALEELERIN